MGEGGLSVPAGARAEAAPPVGMEAWEEELRKRFSPSEIDPGKCSARVFAGGRGGQCRRAPQDGGLCARCGPAPAHGFVTGPVPRTKWKDFKITEEMVDQLRTECRAGAVVPPPRPSEAEEGLQERPRKRARLTGDALRKPDTSRGVESAGAVVRAAGDGGAVGATGVLVGPLLKRRKGDGLGRVLPPPGETGAAEPVAVEAEGGAKQMPEEEPGECLLEGAAVSAAATGDGVGVRSRDPASVAVAEEVQVSASRRRALQASLSDEDIAIVLQRFLAERAATGEAIRVVPDSDVPRVRRALIRDRDLMVVLARLCGAGSTNAERQQTGDLYWARMVDRFLGMLHLRQSELQVPRRLCD